MYSYNMTKILFLLCQKSQNQEIEILVISISITPKFVKFSTWEKYTGFSQVTTCFSPSLDILPKIFSDLNT